MDYLWAYKQNYRLGQQLKPPKPQSIHSFQNQQDTIDEQIERLRAQKNHLAKGRNEKINYNSSNSDISDTDHHIANYKKIK